MINTYYLILVFFVIICSKLYAQQATIKGIIKDKETGVNLIDVYVNIDKTNSHAHSDDKGNFFFINIPFNNYDIEFEKGGYENKF